MHFKQLALFFLILVSTVYAADALVGIDCSTTKTDSYCSSKTNFDKTINLCCTNLTQTYKANSTATTKTTISYQCLPVEFVKSVSSIVYSNTTNYTLSCSTNYSAPTTCSSASSGECSSSIQCCAARGYAISTGAVSTFSSNNCYTTTESYIWNVTLLNSNNQYVTYARQCLNTYIQSSTSTSTTTNSVFLKNMLAVMMLLLTTSISLL